MSALTFSGADRRPAALASSSFSWEVAADMVQLLSRLQANASFLSVASPSLNIHHRIDLCSALYPFAPGGLLRSLVELQFER
jgi:hypothetical protein